MTEKRKKAIIRRRIFVSALSVALAVVFGVLIFIISRIITRDTSSQDGDNPQNSSSDTVSQDEKDPVSSEPTSDASDVSDVSSDPALEPNDGTLDAEFSRLLLVNGNNPLPDDYDEKVRDYLVEIDPEYRNNNYVTQIHKDVYPYITAMVAAAQADDVELYVWSPFRSYAIQSDLFNKQVDRVGGDEALAATVVARPGTSEHNTGLCADFNVASDSFEDTQMFEWMLENAEDYGFILRYPADKQDITGVIYESWHWRFVGINAAKEINSLGMTLEEYIEYKNLDPTVDMYSDDK